MKRGNGIDLSVKYMRTWIYLMISLGILLFINSCKQDKIVKVPEITTTAITTVADTVISGGGNITDDGGADVTERGVCWGTNINPDIELSTKTADGKGIGEFTSSITGLTGNVTYHVRAYATNSAGTAYGKDISFNTTPSLITSEVTSIMADSAVGGGNIIGDGVVLILERGVCWSTDHNPTISNSRRTSDSTGTGTFLCKLTYLSPITTYYIRAYATNPAGTSYGNEVSFTTKAKPPAVSTKYVTKITPTTASSGGYSYSDTRAPIIVQGVCWDTVPGPTIDLATKSVDGNEAGSYTSSIWGLSPKTKYYVRAYATNSGGTGYGYGYSFTTPSYPPTITTTAISSITPKTASSGGNITSDGGSDVTSRGICWSTSPNPTNNLYTRTNNGTGTGEFTSSMTSLLSATTYYVRAYATNSGGTAYGNELSFTTSAVIPTLITTEITSITTTGAISGGNISYDGGATVISHGICWGTASNPTIDLSTKTSDGSGTGLFSSTISSLTANTLYYVRAYATNSAGTAYGNELLLKTYTGSVSDVDGNVYNTVTIGAQVWTVENLKTTKYNDGTAIPYITNNTTWTASSSPAYCWYNNSAASYKATYGALYNWYVVDPASNGGKNVCQVGWHVPTQSELTVLASYLGGYSVAGGKMKEYGIARWRYPNAVADNFSGFTGIPGGYRSFTNGTFNKISYEGVWWSSTSFNNYHIKLFYNSDDATIMGSSSNIKSYGYSVRCLKD